MQGPSVAGALMSKGAEADAWLDDAACADLPIEAFFVQAGHIIDEEVLNVCRTCPVRIDCLKHAYNEDLNVTGGYFGGLSPGQRRELTLEEALAYVRTDTTEHPRKPDYGVEIDDDPIIYS